MSMGRGERERERERERKENFITLHTAFTSFTFSIKLRIY